MWLKLYGIAIFEHWMQLLCVLQRANEFVQYMRVILRKRRKHSILFYLFIISAITNNVN